MEINWNQWKAKKSNDNSIKFIFCLGLVCVHHVTSEWLRDEVYICDEAFFTGTAAEIVPIREYDSRIIGDGKRGPIATVLQAAYFDLVRGKNNKYQNWLAPVAE